MVVTSVVPSDALTARGDVGVGRLYYRKRIINTFSALFGLATVNYALELLGLGEKKGR
jgi:hypothetical protein